MVWYLGSVEEQKCCWILGVEKNDHLLETIDLKCSFLRYIVEAVSRRASMMASAGITALLKKMDYKNVVIAIDGSLFR